MLSPLESHHAGESTGILGLADACVLYGLLCVVDKLRREEKDTNRNLIGSSLRRRLRTERVLLEPAGTRFLPRYRQPAGSLAKRELGALREESATRKNAALPLTFRHTARNYRASALADRICDRV